MIRQRYTNKTITLEFEKIHNKKYDYSQVEYRTMHHKVIIICKIHGAFLQTPNAHMRQKQGCPKCGVITCQSKQKITTQKFIIKSKNLYGERFLYSKVNYINAKKPVILTCRLHGDFNVTPNSHLSSKQVCPICTKIKLKRQFQRDDSFGWSRTNWINRIKKSNTTAKFYILKCWDENETFYKIGITSKKSIHRRYTGNKTLPYNFKVILLIESIDAGYIYDLEHKVLSKTIENKYKPLKPFVGSALECRTKLKYSDIH